MVYALRLLNDLLDGLLFGCEQRFDCVHFDYYYRKFLIILIQTQSNQVCGVRGRFYEGIGCNWILWSDDMMAGEDQSAVIAALLQEAVARPRRSGAVRP